MTLIMYVLTSIGILSFASLMALRGSEKVKGWVLVVLFAIGVSSLIIVCASIKFAKETVTILETKKAQQTLMQISSTEEKYLLQDGSIFEYAYLEDYVPKTEKVRVSDSSVKYDSSQAYVSICQKLIRKEGYFLFIKSVDETKLVKEYEFHLKTRDNIVFSFEN